jgi:glycosyltransferase involved in cell wall biosynthesis
MIKPEMVILLPVYNSEQYLQGVLKSIGTEVWDRISYLLVLDNSSTDRSVQVVREFQNIYQDYSNKIMIQTHAVNLGYGGSVVWGLNWALSRKIEYVMILHSDDQSDWGQVSKSLIERETNDTAVIASRFHRDASIKGYSLKRNLGNRFFKVLTFAASGIKMSDPGSAICLLPSKALVGIDLECFDSGYLFHPQLNLVIYSNSLFQVKEVPLNWHDASTDNSFPIVSYGFSLLKFLLGFWTNYRFRKLPIGKSIELAAK